MINLLKYDKAYDWLIDVRGDYVAYAISGEAYDYVTETGRKMF